jgi:ribosomal protein S12 methylthiotransferase accessory factor
MTASPRLCQPTRMIETDDAFLLRLLGRMKPAGISRLANVTKLDCLKVHLWQAVRPASRNLTVSQGKGLTEVQAKISALMECLELYCAERPPIDLVATANDISSFLGYDPAELPALTGRTFDSAQTRRWTAAVNLISGQSTFVPTALVTLDFHNRTLGRYSLFHTSSGLGGGQTPTQAWLHGMYEAIERDAISGYRTSQGSVTPIDLESVEYDVCRDLLEFWARLGIGIEVFSIPAVINVPCVFVKLVSPDGIPVTFGSACRSSREAALIAALTEAAQSRLTLISGARDDILGRDYPTPGDVRYAALSQQRCEAFASLRSYNFQTLSEEFGSVLRMFEDASLSPMAVALSGDLVDLSIFTICIPKLRLPS